MSDDEEEEEVVEEQQPEVQQEEQAEQQVEDAAEEEPVSAHPSPAKRLIGYATGIQFSFTEKDFGKFLNESNVQYQHIEYESNEYNKFNGKAKVFFDDSTSLDNFLRLNETDINGVIFRTKVWEKRGGRPDRDRGGRGRGNDRGDRDRRGGRGERDNRDRDGGGDYRPARRNPGTSDARNLPGGDEEFGGRGGFRREQSTRSNKSDKEAPLPSPPAGRPKLNLQPRTLPVETIGKLNSPSSSSIFGAGKAQDVFEYEVCIRS